MKPPALELLPDTQPASTYFPPRCGPPRDGPHGPSHPGQIFSACSRFSHLLKRNKTWDTSLRRGWYTPEAKRGKWGPWGYDKIRHKHGIWNIYTINKYFKGLCSARMEDTDRIYETPIYEAFRTNDGKKIGTGRSFELRAVVETINFVSEDSDFEPRGVKTMFPLHDTNDDSDVVPQWFNLEKGLD